MPELPEVETIRRGLTRSLVGRKIKQVELREQRSCTISALALSAFCANETVESINRLGKLLIVKLSGAKCLLIHLRMTGQLIYKASSQNGTPSSSDFGGGFPNQSFVNKLPDKTTRAIFTFMDNSNLFFNDQRKFGYIKPLPSSEILSDPFVAALGPDPLSKDFTVKDFCTRLPNNSKRSIKAVLLDQSIVSGIGNIYADESLFLAKIMPDRPTLTLTKAEQEKLLKAIKSCLQQSIDDGGSTMKDYVDSEGLRGEYLDLHAHVFNRSGLACHACGGVIQKAKIAGRGTHFCPKCQH